MKKKRRGIFIVLDGIDGSGKSTQTKLLSGALFGLGYRPVMIDFPQHGEPPSWFVDKYLTGAYGTAEEVGPYRASIFYACDRYDASFRIRSWLDDGRAVISDRYVSANAGHQGAKIKDPRERKKFIKWLHDLEYCIFKIPKPDISIILKSTPELSHKMAPEIKDTTKAARRASYLGKTKRDIHEEDHDHLRRALDSFLLLAKEFPREYRIIECAMGGSMIPPEEVHTKILEKVTRKLRGR